MEESYPLEETISSSGTDNPEKEKKEDRKLRYAASHDTDENFFALAKYSRKRLRKKWDAVYGVTGEEGVGKSTLAIHLGGEVDRKFQLDRNIVFSPDKDQVRDAIVQLPKYSCVDVDEAIKILYKLNWHSEIQIFLNVVYGLCRRESKLSLLLMPRFLDFNEYFRRHRIKLWVYVVDRGHAVIFFKSWVPVGDDPWLLKYNSTIVDTQTKRYKTLAVSLEKRLKILRKFKNYLMEIKFPPLDKEIETEYEKLRNLHGVYDEGDTGMTRWEKSWRNRYYELTEYLMKNKLLKTRDIAEASQMDVGSLRTFLFTMRDRMEDNSKQTHNI